MVCCMPLSSHKKVPYSSQLTAKKGNDCMLFVMEFLEAFSRLARHWTRKQTMLRRIQSLRATWRPEESAFELCAAASELLQLQSINHRAPIYERSLTSHNFLEAFPLLQRLNPTKHGFFPSPVPCTPGKSLEELHDKKHAIVAFLCCRVPSCGSTRAYSTPFLVW